MAQQGVVQLVEVAVAVRVLGRDGVHLLRRLLGAGVRIGLADLAAGGRRAGTGSEIGEGE
ncbi:hypothetical protein [Kitasatospora sp. HPMI-4]|uniref:hypothetical protein n=1 Tax=Kitasatospora sp. HPMI-4 TaxID=3448443 RepID=UPI003F1999F4